MKSNAFIDSIRDSSAVRLLADSYPSYLSYVDREYRYCFVNRAYEVVFGAAREQIVGKRVEDVWGADAFATIRLNLDRALAGESFTIEMAFQARYLATTYVPHTDDDGQVIGVLVFAQDVTELQASRAAAIHTERMASLGRLVSGLLHELNTPLGVIGSNIDLMHRSIEQSQDLLASCDQSDFSDRFARLEHRLSAIAELRTPSQESLARMRTVIEHLRSFAALDEAETQRLDLHEGLDSTLALLEHRLHDVEVVKRYGELPTVVGRRAALNQVFMSLLMNAVDAIEESGGTIEVRTDQVNDFVHVEISDTGKGISPAQLETLFEPAFVKSSMRVKAGFSLFVSNNIIQKHGGEIRVESTVGAGSKFTVVLRVKD